MEIELKYLIKNKYLKEKVETILKEKNNNKNAYIGCMALLEYINVKLLKDYMKVDMPDYNIVRIMTEYSKVDQKLFDLMVDINGEYNTIDLENIEDEDIESLLYDIDFIYGYILEKYGDIVN